MFLRSLRGVWVSMDCAWRCRAFRESAVTHAAFCQDIRRSCSGRSASRELEWASSPGVAGERAGTRVGGPVCQIHGGAPRGGFAPSARASPSSMVEDSCSTSEQCPVWRVARPWRWRWALAAPPDRCLRDGLLPERLRRTLLTWTSSDEDCPVVGGAWAGGGSVSGGRISDVADLAAAVRSSPASCWAEGRAAAPALHPSSLPLSPLLSRSALLKNKGDRSHPGRHASAAAPRLDRRARSAAPAGSPHPSAPGLSSRSMVQSSEPPKLRIHKMGVGQSALLARFPLSASSALGRVSKPVARPVSTGGAGSGRRDGELPCAGAVRAAGARGAAERPLRGHLRRAHHGLRISGAGLWRQHTLASPGRRSRRLASSSRRPRRCRFAQPTVLRPRGVQLL